MVNHLSKGQVSLEYLMTYGIAIAIVVIAVAALYTMGVFSPKSAAVQCSPCFANFAFVDYAGGTLVAKNGPKDLINVGVSAGATVPGTLTANEQFSITNIPSDPVNNKTVQVVLTYDDALSGLTHTDTATIHN